MPDTPLNPDALEAAARALLAVQQPEVSADYAWNVQFDDGREELRKETAAAVSAYLASAQPELAARRDQAEQAVERVREALSEVQTRGEKIRAKGNNGSVYQQERAARGEGYLEATRLAFRALDGDPRAEV